MFEEIPDPLAYFKELAARMDALEHQQRREPKSTSTGYGRLAALPYAFASDGSFDAEKAEAVANWLDGVKVGEPVTNG